ncbi:Beta-hexosaminidase 3 [Frankliniella fusca]|uniref:Beta-hexosaminidase 3 n=1 Tax=Frankliniella fusca TaxID=407009 RepID=A0AAE1HZQ2_9NEOP|nr:Beta-hexosaminidase 3 [Frankliniella fusca]
MRDMRWNRKAVDMSRKATSAVDTPRMTVWRLERVKSACDIRLLGLPGPAPDPAPPGWELPAMASAELGPALAAAATTLALVAAGKHTAAASSKCPMGATRPVGLSESDHHRNVRPGGEVLTCHHGDLVERDGREGRVSGQAGVVVLLQHVPAGARRVHLVLQVLRQGGEPLSTRSSDGTLSKCRWNFLCRALEVAGEGRGTRVGVDEDGATVAIVLSYGPILKHVCRRKRDMTHLLPLVLRDSRLSERLSGCSGCLLLQKAVLEHDDEALLACPGPPPGRACDAGADAEEASADSDTWRRDAREDSGRPAAMKVTTFPKIVVDGVALDYSPTVDDLGVIIDETLSWGPQLVSIGKKVLAALHGLRRHQQLLPPPIRKRLVEALIFPVFDYCNTVCSNALVQPQLRLQSLQNSCARFVLNLKNDNSSMSPHINKLSWLKAVPAVPAALRLAVARSLFPEHLPSRTNSQGDCEPAAVAGADAGVPPAETGLSDGEVDDQDTSSPAACLLGRGMEMDSIFMFAVAVGMAPGRAAAGGAGGGGLGGLLDGEGLADEGDDDDDDAYLVAEPVPEVPDAPDAAPACRRSPMGVAGADLVLLRLPDDLKHTMLGHRARAAPPAAADQVERSAAAATTPALLHRSIQGVSFLIKK